ncbi:MAG: MBL fold metallo-hydrolase, partial [Candidatus Sabulitectum sp.]|nr:MBL fold metallo-hydrolase [Candidatus Sabulitectum sp.]
MIADQIESNFMNFRFPEEEGFLYGFNLYALVSGRDVLLIDAAFRTQAKQIKKYLSSKGLRLSHVLLTHFHPDHVAGLVV